MYKFKFVLNNSRNNEFKIFFDELFNLSLSLNDVISFKFGIQKQKDFIFYFDCDTKFEELIKQKLKIIIPDIIYENINVQYPNNVIYLNKKTDEYKIKTSTEDYSNFYNNLLTILQNNDTLEYEIIPFININKKHNKKQLVGKALYKTFDFLLETFITTKSQSQIIKNQNIEKTIIVENEFKVCIKLYSDDRLQLHNMSSIFSIFNCETYLKENTDFQYSKFTSEELKMIHLPNKNISDNLIEKQKLIELYDNKVPDKGIKIGEFKRDICMPAPEMIIIPKKYPLVYESMSKIIDNVCKPKLVLGQVGTGKTEFDVILAINYMLQGFSIIAIDPKFDFQKRLIESIPNNLIKNVDFLDLGDVVFPPSFNLFKRRNNNATENSLIVSLFLNYMKKQFGQNWGFKLQHLIQMTCEAILLHDNPTMNEFYLMLTDKIYREFTIKRIEYLLKTKNKNYSILQLKKLFTFWNDFNNLPDAKQKIEIEPTLNKIGPFISNRLINAVVSQEECYDFRENSNAGRITIINLPEGIISRENVSLLSSFIVKNIWVDMQSKDDLDIKYRYPTILMIDEAHEIVDDDFIGILTKARSRRLGLVLITQALSNFEVRKMPEMKQAIAANCKDKFVFRQGSLYDSRDLVDEFIPLTANDILNCPDRHYYSRILLQDGTVSNTFSAKTPDTFPVLRNYDDYIKQHRSGKKNINEIEEQIDQRYQKLLITNKLKSSAI